MRAMVQTRYGAPEQVLRMREIEPPALRAGEALVRVRATTVNTPDWITVTGVPYVLRLGFGLRVRARRFAGAMSPAWWRLSART